VRISILSRSLTRPSSALKCLGLLLLVLLIGAFLLGAALTSEARAAVSYSAEEVAFVKLINDYRVSNGLTPLLVSDRISEACDRHSSDMGKYRFFSHYTVQSDWFPVNAAPWDRMAMSGYDFYTNKGENIAAGQSTAQDVFNAWKGSPGHNANMLNSSYKVIGVALVVVPGAPYTYYWTTDFGGYVDSSAHALDGEQPTAPSPSANRYQQSDSLLVYSGTWSTSSTSYASGGSFRYVDRSGASVTVYFDGTSLTWIAKKSPVYGKARVTVDGGSPVLVDLYSSSVKWQQKVWSTGTLPQGNHVVKIEWTGYKNAAATAANINVDAFDIVGTLTAPPVVKDASSPTRYEQTDSRLDYSGTWYTFYASGSSAGSYKRANTAGSGVTVTFEGTYLAWIATKGTTLGKALVSVDGGPAVCVNLAASYTQRQQKVWNTGTLANGTHTVKIWWDPTNIAGKYISVDAFDVVGTLK
jgi:uncharacterized protein YkwD